MFKEVEGDVAIGLELAGRGYERITRAFGGFHHVKAFDWSGFDSRVRENMLVAAFGVLRTCFRGDDQWLDNLFLRFLSHTLVKQVVVPGGYYYTLTKGIPSGSPFTSLIGSIVNWLVLVDLEIQAGGTKSVRANRRLVYGDDFLQGFAGDAPPKSEYIALAYERWGFVAKPHAAHEGVLCTASVDTSLPFLQTSFPHGLPARPVGDAVRLGLMARKPRDRYGAQLQRAMYLDHFPPFDPACLEFHRAYFLWCQRRAPGFWAADGSTEELAYPYLLKGMVNYLSPDADLSQTSLGVFLAWRSAARIRDKWLPRAAGRSPPRLRRGLGKIRSALSILRWPSAG
jgi:hypothetical protein